MQQQNDSLSSNALRAYIAARRQELRLTQRELAQICNLPLGTLSGIESGRMVRAPRAHTLEKLAMGLKTSYENLDAMVRGIQYKPASEANAWTEDYRYRLFDAVMQSVVVPETERMLLVAKLRTLWQTHGDHSIDP